MKWLISYNLFVNSNGGPSVRRTEIIDIEPSLWWDDELWRKGEIIEWDGCIVLMVHEIPDESLDSSEDKRSFIPMDWKHH